MAQSIKSRAVILAALLTSAMVAPASATDITIQDFVGQITIVEGNDGLDVLRDGKDAIDFRDSRNEIFIDGGLSQKERGKACDGPGIGWNLNFNGRGTQGNTRLEDYPDVRLSVPSGSNLIIVDSSLQLRSDIMLGDVDLDIQGCFDTYIDGADTLRIEKSGSGDIEIGSAGTIDLEKSGSGDVEVGQTGQFVLDQSGSGEVDIDRVVGSLNIEKSGSGDIAVGRIEGDLSVEKSGSGDVDIEDGTISDLSIRNSGSGDVDIHAAVGDAYVRASGSGDVYVKSISGTLDEATSGSSDFSRGDD
ncbi:hypothetical protein GCM10009069_10090 [Algimonas arctica]|uniref:Putative auto-transporter adhesin head GIN domain-containing protein n=1 Tax=Algimonas arctica TaxID=1479486 RepID=A0A8J3CNK8_9PROT|nr:DUF2807 domain-containing protein [Algimonas arctica]GHA89011.1 hypothetical protein GCM10009069_10090 [Algimonas arctica]